MDALESRINDYQLVNVIGSALQHKGDFLKDSPPEVAMMLRNTDAQIEHLRETKEFLFDAIVERRALSSARKVTGDPQP
jgi:hypothetical protein